MDPVEPLLHNYRVRAGKASFLTDTQRWRCNLSYTDFKTGKRAKKIVYFKKPYSRPPTTPEKQAAEEKLLQELRALEADPRNLSTRVKEYARRREAEKDAGTLKFSTWESEKYDLDRLVVLLDNPSDKLPPYTWRDFPERVSTLENDLASWRSAKGDLISPDRHRKTYFLLKKLVGQAEVQGLIRTQPLNNAPKKRDISMTDPTVHSRTVFLNEVLPAVESDPQLKAMVLLCAEAGLRAGEARGLKWGDIEWGEEEPQADGSVLLSGGWLHVKRSGPYSNITKTRRGVRYVPLRHSVMSALIDLVAAEGFDSPWEWVEHDDGYGHYQFLSELNDSFVFLSHRGKTKGQPVSKSGIEKRFKRRLEQAGLPSSQPFQTLRRTFATWNVKAGTPASTLTVWMGHQDFKTTMDYYTALGQQVKPTGDWTEINLG